MDNRNINDIVKKATGKRNKRRWMAFLSIGVLLLTNGVLTSPASTMSRGEEGGAIYAEEAVDVQPLDEAALSVDEIALPMDEIVQPTAEDQQDQAEPQYTEPDEDVIVESLDIEAPVEEVAFELSDSEDVPDQAGGSIDSDIQDGDSQALFVDLEDCLDDALLLTEEGRVWHVNPDESYILRLRFSEREGQTFDAQELHYTLPDGVKAVAESGDTNDVYGVYEVEDGKSLTAYCVFDDERTFSIDLPVCFDGEGTLTFSEEVSREVVFEAAEGSDRQDGSDNQSIEAVEIEDEPAAPQETASDITEENIPEATDAAIVEAQDPDRAAVIDDEQMTDETETASDTDDTIEDMPLATDETEKAEDSVEEDPRISDVISEDEGSHPDETTADESTGEAVPTKAETEEAEQGEAAVPAEDDQDDGIAEQPELLPAQSFAARVRGVTVYVTADEGAFPEGTTMSVAPVYDAGTLGDIADSVVDDTTAVKTVHAVDITFRDAEGREIEPRLPISVRMDVDALEDSSDAVVVHMDDEGNAEVVEQAEAGADVEGEAMVAFDAQAFSVYAVVVTERFITADGQTYNIQVSYDSKAGIPEGATLAVREIDGEEYQTYLDQTADSLSGRSISSARFFDISIMDGDEELQPQAPVEVKITMEQGEGDVRAVHFGDEVELIEEVRQDGETVVFDAESFSVYGIVYTVDFHFGRYTYKLSGGSTMLVSFLLDALETGVDVSRVVDVTFSNPALLTVERMEDGDWLLTSLKAFSTPELLTLTLDDGSALEISVTDPPHGANEGETMQDIADFLTKAEIYVDNSTTFIGGSEGDTAKVRYGQTYKISLTFAEMADSEEFQFTDKGDCVMYFDLPDELSDMPIGPLENLTIDLGGGKKLEGNTVKIVKDETTGKMQLQIQWNDSNEENFELLTDSPRTTFTLNFNATIDTTQNHIEFNSSTKVDVIEDTSFNIDLHKTGKYITDYADLVEAGYHKEPGKGLMKYTVTVTAKDGDGHNIKVEDTLTNTNALKYVKMVDGQPTNLTMACEPATKASRHGKDITPEYKNYTEKEDDSGFSLTIPELAEGQTATLVYYAEVEYANLTGRGTEEETSNTVTADGPDVHVEETFHPEGGIAYADIAKEAESIEDYTDASGKTWYLVPWVITYNNQKEISVEGATLTDTIYSGAMDAMQFLTYQEQIKNKYSGAETQGAIDEAIDQYKFKVWVEWVDGTTEIKNDWWQGVTVEDFEYTDEDARISTKGTNWSYTLPQAEALPDGVGAGPYSYRIKYYTLVDPSLLVTGKDGTTSIGNQVGESATQNSATGTAVIQNPNLDEKELSVEKKTLQVNKDYIQWQVSFDRREYDLDRAVLVDTLPNYGGAVEQIVLNDTDHKIEVAGLYADEGNVSVEPSKFGPTVLFRFFKNNDPVNPKPGLRKLESANDEDHKKITVTFWTKNDQNWLEKAVESDWPAEHENNVTLYANSQEASAKATGMPKVPKLKKDGKQVGTLKKTVGDKKDVPLPVLEFTLTLSGLDETWFDGSGNLIISDDYDDHLRLLNADELAAYPDANKLVLVKPSGTWSEVVAPAVDGEKMTITVSREAFKNGDNYDFGLIYKLKYYMILDEDTAIKKATEALTGGEKYNDPKDNNAEKTTKKGHAVFKNSAGVEDKNEIPGDAVAVDVDLQPIDKSVQESNGRYRYTIEINPMKLKVNNGSPYSVKDVYQNLAVDFTTVEITASPQTEIEYAYHSNEGIFQIPDETHVTISYYAWPVGPKDKTFTMTNTASMLGFEDTVDREVKLSSDFNGSAGVYSVNVYKYADNNMADVRQGAVFQLYGKDAQGNVVPLTYKKAAEKAIDPDRTYYTDNWTKFQNQEYFSYASADKVPTLLNHKVGDPIYFVTGADGVAEIRLSMKRDGLGLDMGLQYYLKEVVAPEGLHAEMKNGEPLLWQFMLSDIDDFSHYIYRDGGVLSISNASGDNGLVIRKEIVGGDKLKYDRAEGDSEDQKYTKDITFLIVGPNSYRREVKYSEFVKDENGDYRFMLPKGKLEAGEYTVYELKDTADIDSSLYTWTGTVEGMVKNGGEVKEKGVKDENPYVTFTVTAEDLTKDTVLTAAFTNTYSEKQLTLTKVWKGNYDGWTSKSVTFNLYKNGKLYKQVTLDENADSVTLPLTTQDSKGNDIRWAVAEAVVHYTDENGEHTISGKDIDEQFSVTVNANGNAATQTDRAWAVVVPENGDPVMEFTNTHETDGLVDVRVKKQWPADASDTPEVTFDLYKVTTALPTATPMPEPTDEPTEEPATEPTPTTAAGTVALDKDGLKALVASGATLVREGIVLNAENGYTYEAKLKAGENESFFALERSVAGYVDSYTYNKADNTLSLVIDNESAGGNGTLTVSKEVLGLSATQLEGRTFVFAVTNNGKYLNQNGTFTDKDPGYTVAATETGSVTFENVRPGEYTIAELNPEIDGKTVKVYVDGKETADHTAKVTVESGKTVEVKLKNEYKTTDFAFDKLWVGPNSRDTTALVWPNEQEISVTVQRRDDGGTVDGDWQYTYTLKRSGDSVTATSMDAGAPTMTVSTANANVYRFTLKDLEASKNGNAWTYFATETPVSGYETHYGRADGIVAVMDKDGKDAAPIGANGTPAAIINRVSTRPVTIPVQKAISGRKIIRAGEFSFQMKRSTDADYSNAATASVDDKGIATFDLPEQDVSNMTLKYVDGRLVLHGTIVYNIKELIPENPDPTITYYKHEVTVTDEITIDWESGETNHTLNVYYPDGTESDDVSRVKITNGYKPGKRTLNIKKTWDDSNNQDGLRRDITVAVTAIAEGRLDDGTEYKYEKELEPVTVDLRGATRKEAEVTGQINVPVYVESKPVTKYVVKEVVGEDNKLATMPDYTVVVGQAEVTDFTQAAELKNKHEKEKINVKVTKLWKDDADHTDRRASVMVELYQNGTSMGEAYKHELTEANGWTWTWENLDRYTPEKVGVIARYTVKEAENSIPIGYKVENTKITTTAAKDGTAENEITNTYDETVEVGVKKVWDDDNDRDGKRTDITGVTMKLVAKVDNQDVTDAVLNAYFADDTRKSGIPVTGVNEWETETKWSPLPKYYNGKVISYTVEEDDSATTNSGTVSLANRGYTSAVTGTDNNGVRTVKNTHNVQRDVELTLTKVWQDDDNQDGLRPSRLKKDTYLKSIVLYANGEKVYENSAWLNNALANDIKKSATVVLTGYDEKNTDYTVKFSNLPVNTEGGVARAVEYKLAETSIEGYTLQDGHTAGVALALSADKTLTLTNKHEPATVKVTANKKWLHNNNSILKDTTWTATLRLVPKLNGHDFDLSNTKYKGLIGDKTLTWSGSDSSKSYNVTPAVWDGLPRYAPDHEGEPLEYDVIEVRDNIPDGYHYRTVESDHSVDETTGDTTVILVNVYEETTVSATKVWDDDNNRDDSRVDVTFQLYRKIIGQDSDYQPVTGEKKNISKTALDAGLTVRWEHLPKWIKNQEVVYDVREVRSDELTAGKYEVNDSRDSVQTSTTSTVDNVEWRDYTTTKTITNTRNIDTTKVEFTKTWKNHGDSSHQLDQAAFKQKLHLYYRVKGTTAAPTEVTDDLAPNWRNKIVITESGDVYDTRTYTCTINNLPLNLPKASGHENDTKQELEYFVTEEAMEHYTASNSDWEAGTTNLALAVQNDQNITNEHNTKDLTISKALVSDRTADGEEMVFEFQVTSDPTVNFTYQLEYTDSQNLGHDSATTITFVNGRANATVKLKKDQSVKIVGLPTGVTYTVTEQDKTNFETPRYSLDSGAETTGKACTIVMGSDDHAVAFTNTRSTGALKVSKTVVSAVKQDRSADFHFKVMLKDNAITKDFGDVSFANGEATITVKAGESKTISGLPTDVAYTIEEYGLDETETTYLGEFNTSDDTTEVDKIVKGITERTFTNTRKTGSLKVTKEILKAIPGDDDREFEFTLTLTPEADKTLSLNDAPGLTVQKGTAQAVPLTFNANNKATFTVCKSDGNVVIDGIPVGTTYRLEETDAYANFEHNTVAQSGTIVVDNGTVKEKIGEAAPADITGKEFTNERKVGDLSLEKVIGDEQSKISAEREATYEVEVTLKTKPGNVAIGNWPITIEEVALNGTITPINTESEYKTDANGKVKVLIKADRTVTLKDLPTDSTFSVSETRSTTPDVDSGNFTVTYSGKYEKAKDETDNTKARAIPDADDEILADDTAKMTVKNTRRVGELTVKKSVVSTLSSDEYHEFRFKVQVAGPTEAFKLDAGDYGDVHFGADNESDEFTLKHNGTKTISGLPTGWTYTVIELPKDGSPAEADYFGRFDTTWAAGTITGNAGKVENNERSFADGPAISGSTAEVTCTNTRRTGGLKLAKTVISPFDSDKSAAYTFTVTVTMPTEGQAQGESYTLTYKVDGVERTAAVTDGKATISVDVDGGKEKTITGLPVDAVWTVAENAYTVFNTSYLYKKGDEQQEGTTESNGIEAVDPDVGTLTLDEPENQEAAAVSTANGVTYTAEEKKQVFANETSEIEATNSRKAQPITFKKVNSNEPETSQLEGAKFTLTSDQEGQDGSIALTSDANGMLVPDNNASLPEWAKLDGKGAINLPLGTYALTETRAPDGFNSMTKPVEITVEPDGVSYKAYFYNQEEEWSYCKTGNGSIVNQTDVNVMLLIPNSPGVALPSTGGPGTTLFTVVGSILTLLAAALLIVKRRNY